jgi:hypothetical protein
MSSRVTARSVPTTGSTLRGTPRSITSMGPATPEKCAAVSTWASAATAANTTSARASSAVDSSREAARSCGPRPAVRTRSSARPGNGSPPRWNEAPLHSGYRRGRDRRPCPSHPAPTTSTRLSRSQRRLDRGPRPRRRGRTRWSRGRCRSRCAPVCPSAARAGRGRTGPATDMPSSWASSKARLT